MHTNSLIRRGWVAFSQRKITLALLQSRTSARQDGLLAGTGGGPEPLTSVPSVGNTSWLPGLFSLVLFLHEELHEILVRESCWLLVGSSPEPARLSRRLARGTTILVFELLRKRVLKFKPRGAELSSSLSGQEPPSPFPKLRSKAQSQHLSRSWSKPPGLWGAAGLAPPSSAAPAKKLGRPRACRVLSVALPEPQMLPSLLAPRTVTQGSGPLVGCSAEAPAASSPGGQRGGPDPWKGLLGPAAHAGRITIQINPEQGEAAITCLNTLSVNKTTRGLAEHYGVVGAAAPIFQVGKLGQ